MKNGTMIIALEEHYFDTDYGMPTRMRAAAYAASCTPFLRRMTDLGDQRIKET